MSKSTPASVGPQLTQTFSRRLKQKLETHSYSILLKKSKEAFAFNLFLITNENINHYRYAFAEIDVTLLFFMFWREKKLKASYFEKKTSIVGKFQ